MAIGDKPNQNLFGTNYNAEEEERKKAELAAQGAMMGAGVGTQDPLLRSFEDSLLKGQSQNNPFGQAGTQAGQEMANNIRESRGIPASAFGQAPAVAPFSMEAVGQVNPMMQQQNLESFAQPQVTFRDYDVPATPPASALSVFTPGGEVKPNVDVNAITPSPETTTEAAPKNALLEMLERGDERQSMGLPRQAAPGIIDAPSSVVDPFTGKTIEKPTAFAADNSLPAGMTMNQAAIMNALPDQNQGMDMNQQAIANAQSKEAGQGQVPAAPTSGLTTVGGASLSEFLSGRAMPEQGFTQEESPLGGRGVTLTQDQMNQLSAERESRIGADQAISDRDRRAARGDGISMADQVDMAKANARGATPREVARGNQVANALGLDLKTGQPLQATGGLTFDQQLAQNKFEFDVNKFNFEQAKEASDEATANAQSATAAKFAVRDQLRQGANVMDKAQRAGKNIGFFTTGATGALFGLVAGTRAYDQKATVETLEADAAFSALQRMRDASKTGGALGNVSERELDLLKATAGSLRVGQSEEQFRENLAQYVERYNEAMLNIYDAFVADYGEKDANEAFKVNDRQDLIPQQGDNQSTGGGTTTETASGRYSVTVL
jgi:hypothetical protein